MHNGNSSSLLTDAMQFIYVKMNALQCVSENDVCALRMICTQARNENKLEALEEPDTYGNTALLKACYQGKLEAAQILILFGGSLRAINYFGQNALTLASYSGNEELVRELLCHRTYEDFNLSSILPAICVAALRQNGSMMKFFRGLVCEHSEVIQTVHGLKATDIEAICKEVAVAKNRLK